jgi:hypothetical protein
MPVEVIPNHPRISRCRLDFRFVSSSRLLRLFKLGLIDRLPLQLPIRKLYRAGMSPLSHQESPNTVRSPKKYEVLNGGFRLDVAKTPERFDHESFELTLCVNEDATRPSRSVESKDSYP